jgi:uncharacterized membrane protein
LSGDHAKAGDAGGGNGGEPVLRVEVVLSHLLRAGVIISVLTILAGVAIVIMHHPDYASSRHSLSAPASADAGFPHSLGEVADGLRQGRGIAVIAVGLLLLILTPVMRVAVSVVAFAIRRDWTYTVFTLIVLILLLVSFALGRGG